MMGTRCGKVKSYWPGKAPEWATFVDEDEAIRMPGVVALEKTFPTQEEDSNSSRWDDDRRLIRLANSRINNREDIIADHKRIRLTDNIVSTTREEENARKKKLADLDEDTMEERRRVLREKLLKRQEEEAAFIPEEEEEDEIEKEEEEQFEYETDFEDITKKQMDERKLETKSIVAQEIWKDEQVQKNIELREANILDVDTDDEVNMEEELEAWTARMIARIKRDEEELMLKIGNEEDSNSSRWDDDRRLIRLANSRINNREDIIADHKRIRLTDNIVSTTREEENARKKELADLDEDTLEERRKILREKLLKRQEEEAAFILEEEEEDEIEKEEEEEFEYETDFENEMTGLVLVKPVFVSKSENGIIAERERLEARKQALEDITKKRMEERKLETKLIVAQEIWKDEQVQKNMELREANIPNVDTDEEVNKEEEREAWKARKIARIKRDEEELMLKQKQKDEIRKVRNMSDEERRQWEREIVKPMLA
ncbi:hypothetical protein Vadar_007905 [Vaccinium darrowii]|uniref:Uncharacterized protein n=1 Tax=Vaccinium darrowii TaxID=229202 RepID=A0ACB7XNZ6_9ERIC|nr:hypothetical protein Vadar_007905 [Vaccinium darrowii]